MPDNSKPSRLQDERFENVLADILLREEAGEPLDLSSVMRAHPDLESRLREYFCVRDAFRRVADNVVPTRFPEHASHIDCLLGLRTHRAAKVARPVAPANAAIPYVRRMRGHLR
jgi:hypothetical protein